DKSLLRAQLQADGEPRFFMLETVREFGREQLAESGELVDVRLRHLDFFTRLATMHGRDMRGNPPVSWIDRLEEEHGNLRADMDWLIASGDATAALELASSMGDFWRMHNHYAEGRSLITRALALPRPPEAAPPPPRARALATLGVLATHQGDFSQGLGA